MKTKNPNSLYTRGAEKMNTAGTIIFQIIPRALADTTYHPTNRRERPTPPAPRTRPPRRHAEAPSYGNQRALTSSPDLL